MTKKPTKTQRTKASSEILKAEELYSNTGDFRFVVLTIGRCRPDKIPQWALDACHDYYKRWQLNHRTFITPNKWIIPKASRDGKLLDIMADYLLKRLNYIDGKKITKANVHAAAKYAAEENAKEQKGTDAFNPDIQRLTRAWENELKMLALGVSDDDAKALTSHPRMERAFLRWREKNLSKA